MIKPERLRKNIYIVRGKSDGLEAWHIVSVDGVKLALFKHALESGSLDVSKFGAVLESGWGSNPPADIIQKFSS